MKKKMISISLKMSLVVLSCFVLTSYTTHDVEIVTTTFEEPWQNGSVADARQKVQGTLILNTKKTDQTMEGFGTCFNEMGWISLQYLSEADRNAIMRDLFSTDGMNMTVNRMPMASNDFSFDYYSYDDIDGDFDMKAFSISHDEMALIPFIKAALAVNPNFRLWASPWCPPSWMKYNKHYACTKNKSVETGLTSEQVILEGNDAFIQDPRYLKAYATYFGKFVDAYKQKGINISMVMPQNEFNSDQPYPACVWKAGSLANFIGKYLGPEMEKHGVDVFYGTIERPSKELSDSIINDPDAKKYIKGLGFQWAGKAALPQLRAEHPDLPLYQTEQECGNGKNNWGSAMHSWNLMKYYIGNGVQSYTYWNTSLVEGGVSRWGWSQNSMVVVNNEKHTYRYTPEYYVMRHTSHFVQKGAKRIVCDGTFDDVLAFINPDGSTVVVAGNQTSEPYNLQIKLDKTKQTITLKPNSLSTIFIK